MKVAHLAVAGSLALFPSPATAGAIYVDGIKYLGYCRDAPLIAMMYATGVSDTFSGLDSNYTPVRLCNPIGITNQQVKEISCKYVADNPDKLHWSAPVLIWLSINEAFPCN
jgi:hypothetical protein